MGKSKTVAGSQIGKAVPLRLEVNIFDEFLALPGRAYARVAVGFTELRVSGRSGDLRFS